MRYLLCRDCGFSYELEEGESIDDFQSCNCGGKLYYSEDGVNISKDCKKVLLDEIITKRIAERKFKQVDSKSHDKSFLTIFIAAVGIFILISLFSPRMWRILSFNFPLNIMMISVLFIVFFLGFLMYSNSNLK